MLNLRSCPQEQDPTWDISLGFCTNFLGLIRSFAETGEESLQNELRKLQWNPPSHNSSGLDRRDGGRHFLHKKAERINQESQKNLCQTFQTEAAIDLACDQQVLREHFPQTARSHREEILLPDLEEIYEPRHLVQDEDEDDETETARPLSEREKRELFRQHRNLAANGAGSCISTRRSKTGSFSVVLRELRCPTCEARLLPLPHRPGMSPHCLRFNQCIGVDLVDLEVGDEVGDGASAKAWFAGDRAPDCSALVDKLLREDRDERVQNCLGETLWMAGDHCT